MFNAKCNVRGNPEMQEVEKKAQALWGMLPKTITQWKEYKECLETLGNHWSMEERKKANK